MKREDLQKILELHTLWLDNEEGGVRAYLQGANLRSANLQDANLRSANLQGAYLQGANLRDANLQGAYLQGANLQYANLQGAYLQGAYLRGAYLRGAKLQDANLRSANLQGAYLRGANLRGANLQDANLRSANLQGANLGGANLGGVNYNDTTIGVSNLCPEGDFIGWKKVNDYLIKLLIPADAKRSNATTYKCRCEFAKVLDICMLDNEAEKTTKVINDNYVRTVYQVGEIVRADGWDDDRWNECSNGIHFFIDKEMAKSY